MYATIVTLLLLIGFITPMFGQERQEPTKPGRKSSVPYLKQDSTRLKQDSTRFKQDSTRLNPARMDTTRIHTGKKTQDLQRRRDSSKKPWMNAPVDTSMRNEKGAAKSRLP